MATRSPDYHRILGVEPNASLETLRRAYRKLMFEKKLHPDLGGNHAVAAEINESYAVLSEKAKQAEDHRTFASQRKKQMPPLRKPSFEFCPLCCMKLPKAIAPESRCDSCHSPLDEPPKAGNPGSEVFGRRSSLRTAKSNDAKVFAAEYPEGLAVRMRDLSLSGISFIADAPLTSNQTFRFQDTTLEAVATVVSCNRLGKSYSIHSKLLTVGFLNKAGVFLSEIG